MTNRFTIFRLRSVIVSTMMLQACVLAAAAQDGPVVELNPDAGDGEAIAIDEGVDAGPPWRLPAVITVTARAGYDENVNTRSSDESGSFFSSGGISVSYEFGTSRTRASLRSHAGLTFYSEIERSPIDPNLNLAFSVSHAVSLRLSLSAQIDARYQIEPDFEIDGSSNRRRGNYFYNRDSFSAAYQWLPRISTVSSYSFGTLQYDEETLATGRNRFDHSIGQQLRYLLRQTTNLTAGYTLSIVDYNSANRDSTSHSLLVGLDEAIAIGPRLRGSARLGAQFRSVSYEFSDDNGVDVSPYFDGNLSYPIGADTSVNANARYSIDEFNSLGGQGSRTFRTGLRLQHQLTRTIGTNLAAYYRHYSNDGIEDAGFDRRRDLSEDAFDISVGASFAIHRLLSGNVGYHFTHVESDRALGSYSRSRYFIGLSSTF